MFENTAVNIDLKTRQISFQTIKNQLIEKLKIHKLNRKTKTTERIFKQILKNNIKTTTELF